MSQVQALSRLPRFILDSQAEGVAVEVAGTSIEPPKVSAGKKSWLSGGRMLAGIPALGYAVAFAYQADFLRPLSSAVGQRSIWV